jgi:formamidopyrimidine-DNA glycosylase
MPELPEVETTRRGISPLCGDDVVDVVVRESKLRWPIPRGLRRTLTGRRLLAIDRRAKYLLLRFDTGCLILHLGMSGSLRIVAPKTPAGPHDHLDIAFASGRRLRLRDPRRFGSAHWTRELPELHALLSRLGPEPFAPEFDGAYLQRKARNRTTSIKQFVMDGKIVVGVGNIYASEALHAAGVHPARPAGRIALARLDRLVQAIRETLEQAIAKGGTSLRDFVGGDGEPGYFRQQLKVYQREGERCGCGRGVVRMVRIGQRATFFCPACQR